MYDARAVRQWLSILHGDSPGLTHICSTDDWSGRTYTDLDAATNYVTYLDSEHRQGIYARVSTLKQALPAGKRGGAADTCAIPAMWCDLDIDGPGHEHQVCPADCTKQHTHITLPLPPDEDAGRQVIANTGFPEPTIWIHSGGGLYPIWLFSTPWLIDDNNRNAAKTMAADWQKIIENAAAELGWWYGRGVGDLARVLRIPGTINRKEGLARPCRIISASPHRYTVEELQEALDKAHARYLPETSAAPVVPATPVISALAPTTPRAPGQLTPGDDFAARTTWAQILEPAGWKEHYQQDGVTYWTRPGKDTGTSASTNALGTDHLHVFTTSALPLEGNESYSKLGAYATLRHGGDHSAAVRELAAAGYGIPLPDPGEQQRQALGDILGQPQERVEQIVAEAAADPARKRTWDDIGNADRLVDRYADRIRFAVDAEKWAVYVEDSRWAFDGSPTYMLGLVRQMLDDLPDTEAYEYDDTPRVDANNKEKPSERQEFFKFVGRQRIHSRMVAATIVARTAGSVQAHMGDFDADPFLLNCRNGVIDLRTGELVEHKPEMMLASITGCEYRPDAQAPQWQRFLATVMPEQDVRAYLARIIGYTLTGDTGEQVLFLHHGSGANGKGVFLQVCRALLGTYGQSIPQDTLLAKPGAGGGIPNDVARMIGKRLLITSETGVGRHLDDELVKQLTGGDEVSARFMRGEFFEFTPVGKIHIMTNHLPNVSGGDGIARRLQDIGWNITIPPEKRDRHLAARIIAQELPGVLAWAVRGCLEWQQQGLDAPAAVRRKTAEHVFQADPIAQWAEERTAATEGSEVETRQLYTDYKSWTEDGGARPMTEKAFIQVLDERKWQRGKHPTTRRSLVYGVRLLPRLVGQGLIGDAHVAF